MKQILIFFSLLMIGCTSPSLQPPTVQQSKLFVLEVKDFSASTDYILDTDSGTARLLYSAIAAAGGTLRVAGIYAESDRQQFTTIHIDPLPDTTAPQISNVYIRARAAAQQRTAIARIEQKTQRDIQRYLAAVNKPHDSKYTDLASVFSIIRTACNQENFNGYRKFLILESDLVNNPKGRNKQLIPVHLDNTTVLVVRPAIPEDSIKKLFPDSEVYCFTDLSDAIAMIR